VVDEEKDVGVFTVNNLKIARQCAATAAKAMSDLGIIKCDFKSIDSNNFMLLYKTYVRHMYCIQAKNPYIVKDIECLEKVQSR